MKWTPLDLNFGRMGNRMFQLAYVYGQVKRGEIPDVWIQDPKYFDAYRREIQELFGAQITPRPEISMHVRRGDYVGHSAFVDLTAKGYYERALATFQEDRPVLIFSDDPEFCRKRWFGPRFTVFEQGHEFDDLIAMASCRDHVIANSSYSWWAAYLDPNPDKRVIYPTAWHTDGIVRIGFPPEWEACE